jgi:hypothetical protein
VEGSVCCSTESCRAIYSWRCGLDSTELSDSTQLNSTQPFCSQACNAVLHLVRYVNANYAVVESSRQLRTPHGQLIFFTGVPWSWQTERSRLRVLLRQQVQQPHQLHVYAVMLSTPLHLAEFKQQLCLHTCTDRLLYSSVPGEFKQHLCLHTCTDRLLLCCEVSRHHHTPCPFPMLCCEVSRHHHTPCPFPMLCCEVSRRHINPCPAPMLCVMRFHAGISTLAPSQCLCIHVLTTYCVL